MYIQKVKNDLIKCKDLKTYKRAIRISRKYRVRSGESKPFRISLQKLSSLYGISKTSIYKTIKQLDEAGLVKVIKNKPQIVSGMNGRAFKAVQPLNCFYNNGLVYKPIANTYVF